MCWYDNVCVRLRYEEKKIIVNVSFTFCANCIVFKELEENAAGSVLAAQQSRGRVWRGVFESEMIQVRAKSICVHFQYHSVF